MSCKPNEVASLDLLLYGSVPLSDFSKRFDNSSMFIPFVEAAGLISIANGFVNLGDTMILYFLTEERIAKELLTTASELGSDEFKFLMR